MPEKVYAVYRRRIPYVGAVPYEEHLVVMSSARFWGQKLRQKHWNN